MQIWLNLGQVKRFIMTELCADDGDGNSLMSLSIPYLSDAFSSDLNLNGLSKDIPIYHRLVKTLANKDFTSRDEYYKWLSTATKIVYTLSLQGYDTNAQDKDGNIALLNYLSNCDYLYDDLIIAFLRCGADSCLKNKDGLDCLQYILQNDKLPKQIRARILEFMPGIWRAVDSDDVGTVRRLINQWCTIDIEKHGLSVLQLAYSKGTENIIRVISGIGPSMNLAHAVLAGNIETVRKILTSNTTVNVNLKNMSDRGATPVYYAICDNNIPMVELLMTHGARLDLSMKGENENDLPLYFAVLSHTPAVSIQIARLTIPSKPISVDSLYYLGRNIIFYCIEHNVDVELFEDILRSCSAYVLTQRVENNFDARQYAVVYGKQKYVAKIDQVVLEWCLEDKHVVNRNILCLHGYQFILPITADNSESCDKWTQFMKLYKEFEEFKQKLRTATEDGDAISVKEMLECKSWSEKGLDVCLADCRVFKDGQPLLHKAALREHYELANYMVYNAKQKLDTVRDQYFRTALHYIYGMQDSKILITTLEDLGMSEYVMDKDGRSPLAFKDRRNLKEMEDLLMYHLAQDLSYPEPDPWSVALPLPITGFLKTCMHENHKKKDKKKDKYLDKKKEKHLYDKLDKSQNSKTHHTAVVEYDLDFSHHGQHSHMVSQYGHGHSHMTEQSNPGKFDYMTSQSHKHNPSHTLGQAGRDLLKTSLDTTQEHDHQFSDSTNGGHGYQIYSSDYVTNSETENHQYDSSKVSKKSNAAAINEKDYGASFNTGSNSAKKDYTMGFDTNNSGTGNNDREYDNSTGSLLYSSRYSDNGENNSDGSELSSDEGYTYNDYEGDQSEVESENEEEKRLQEKHCVIL